MLLLSASQVSKSFDGNHLALDQVSLDLGQGEILCIAGRSGSGKTTLLKILAGLLQPDQGIIRFQEKLLEGPAQKLVPGHPEIRVVFQEFNLLPRLTVRENIQYALIDFTDEYQDIRTEKLLEVCHLRHVGDQYVHELSGGEKQRVSFARALAPGPAVILMDEPFSNLDVITKGQLIREVHDLAKALTTAIILVTHDPRDALEIADRILVLDKGKIIREGIPEDLYRQPGVVEVAQLFGHFSVFSKEEIGWLIPDLEQVEKPGTYGVWAEDLLLSKRGSGLKGIIRKVVFSGGYHRLYVDIDFKKDLVALDHSKKLKVGERVRLHSNANKVIFFE